MPKILILDLETTGLNANRGHILCASAKWYDSKEVMTWRIDSNEGYGSTPASWVDDRPIIRALVALCNKADAVVAYYGGYGKFDIPYLNTRAVAHGLQPCAQLSIIDPYTTAKSKLKLERNGLGAVADVLKCKLRKYHLPWSDWEKARYGDRKAMDRMVKYCANDILALEEVYTRLLPLMNTHPYVANSANINPEHRNRQCPACGSTRSVSKGRRFTRHFEVMRRQCKDCRHNFQSGSKKV